MNTNDILTKPAQSSKDTPTNKPTLPRRQALSLARLAVSALLWNDPPACTFEPADLEAALHTLTEMLSDELASDPPDSGARPISRRSVLAGLLALPLLALTGKPASLENPDDTRPTATPSLAAIAWQRIPDNDRLPIYQAAQLRNDPTATAGDAARLRWGLSQAYCYPLVCYPLKPTIEAKRPIVEANQRAAIIDLVEQMSGPDLASVFHVARTLALHPLDDAGRAELGRRQRARFAPWDGSA